MLQLQAQQEIWKAARARLMAPRREQEIASAIHCAALPSRFEIEAAIPKNYRLIYYGASEVVTDEWGIKAPAGKLIIRTVAAHYHIPVSEMLSSRRRMDCVRARQIACYLAREMTKLSYPQIGKLTGGRDHSTALHANSKVSSKIKSDEDFAAEVDVVRQKILRAMADSK